MRANDIDVAKRLLRFVPEKGSFCLGMSDFCCFGRMRFGALRKLLFEQLGPELAPALLSQFGYRCGIGDYESLTSQYSWDSEVDRLSAGPTMHCWEGLVRATLTALS